MRLKFADHTAAVRQQVQDAGTIESLVGPSALVFSLWALALYYFGDDAARRERVLRETMSGGVTVNDTLLHFANEALPFGGVGPSGQGAYHGERSFVLFSNEKPVFTQARLAATRLLNPPYGALFDSVLSVLNRLKG